MLQRDADADADADNLFDRNIEPYTCWKIGNKTTH